MRPLQAGAFSLRVYAQPVRGVFQLGQLLVEFGEPINRGAQFPPVVVQLCGKFGASAASTEPREVTEPLFGEPDGALQEEGAAGEVLPVSAPLLVGPLRFLVRPQGGLIPVRCPLAVRSGSDLPGTCGRGPRLKGAPGLVEDGVGGLLPADAV